MPGNKWTEKESPMNYSLYRNAPFFIMGAVVIIVGFVNRQVMGAYEFLWLAVLLSFAFYAPVTIFTGKHKMLGMLMLPKTCMYVWILTMLMRM